MWYIHALLWSSLSLLASASDPESAQYNQLGLRKTPTLTTPVLPRSLDKRCEGTCEECFGAGYTLCPDSSIYCYKPGDPSYGIDSCPGESSSGSSATTSTDAAANPTSTTTDICTQYGATCASCFGSSYVECPNDSLYCYDPSDPESTCPSNSSGSGSGSGGGNSNSCAEQYGTGSEPCGTDSCYNPSEGDVCCADGYHCGGGYTCSSIVGECCPPDSTSTACGGSGGLSSYSSSYTYTSDDYAAATSSYDYGYAASSSDSFLVTTTSSSLTTDITSTPSSDASQVSTGARNADLVAGWTALCANLLLAVAVAVIVL